MRFLVRGSCICGDEARGRFVERFVSEVVKAPDSYRALWVAAVQFEARTGLSPLVWLDDRTVTERRIQPKEATLVGFPVTRDAQRD